MPDQPTFHRLTGGLNQPMLVVTTHAAGERSGCLVGFATQCSIHPERFLVLLSDQNHTFRVAQQADALAVHLLGDDDRHLAELFGAETGDEVDKFERCAWSTGPADLPILDDVEGWFAGRVIQRTSFGDHVGHVLEPIAAHGRPPERPLTLGEVTDLDPGHDA